LLESHTATDPRLFYLSLFIMSDFMDVNLKENTCDDAEGIEQTEDISRERNDSSPVSIEENSVEEVTKEEERDNGTEDSSAISADIAYVKANIVKAAVVTVSREYITVVIM